MDKFYASITKINTLTFLNLQITYSKNSFIFNQKQTIVLMENILKIFWKTFVKEFLIYII